MGADPRSERLARGARRVALWAAAASGILALAMLALWLADLAGVASIAGELPGVFSFCAVVLLLGAGAIAGRAAAAPAAVPAILGIGMGLAAAANVAIQFPLALAAGFALPADGTPMICLGYLLLALSVGLLLVERRDGRRWSEGPAALALLFALGGLLHQFVEHRVAGHPERLPMLLGLLLLSIAALLSEPGRGHAGLLTRDGPGGVLARRLIPPAIALPLLLAAARWQGETLGLFDPALGVVAGAALAVALVLGLILATGWQLQRAEERRRDAAARLRVEQEQFRTAFESAAIGMALVGLDGRIVRANTAVADMLGRTRDDLAGRTFQEITHPDDLALDLQYFRQVIAGTLASYQMEKRYLHRDGHAVWGQLTATLVRDGSGRPLHLVSQVQNVSQRHEAEAQLAAAYSAQARTRALLEAVIDSTPDLIAALDPEFNYLAINRACADEIDAVYGFRPGVGTNLLAPLADRPEEQRAVRELWARGLAGERFTVEGAFGDPARARRVYELTIAPVRGPMGVRIGASLVGRDISHRKDAETRLRESEAQFRALIEQAPDALLAVDDLGTIRLANAEAAALLGVPREALAGTPIAPFLPGVSPADLLAELRGSPGALRLGHDAPFHVQPRTGAPVPVEVGLARIEIAGEGLALATVRNLSDRERILAALRETEDRLNIALRAAHMGIWNLAPGDNILTWDAFMGPLFGLPLGHQPLGAEEFWALVHEEDKPRVQETVVTALLCRAEYYDEYRVVWPDGETHWIATRGRVHRDGNDVPVRMAGACWDITDRKRDETRLRELAEELGQINADLEQFAYAASHDLQEPLRAVAGCVQILERRWGDTLDDEGREVIGHAVDGARRMQRLIEDLLAYSRVGTREKVFAEIALGGALDEALRNLQVAVEESGAVVERGDLPLVVADPAQMRQLFQNLIGNAIKFRGADAPRVSVSAEREAGAWRVCVRDNGIGVDPAHADRIFHVFQRLHTRREYPGTGIGLAICKRIVERHGGRIWVEGAVGEGAAFYFTIPDRSPTA